MILGIGIDLAEAARFESEQDKRGDSLFERLFTPGEILYCRRRIKPWPCYAARFAAKEAFFKALGTGQRGELSWRDVEVINDELGKPSFKLKGACQEKVEQMGALNVHLSLTHSDETAAAVVILEGPDK